MKSMPAADAAAIEYAVRLLRQGRLVAFPTETVYGLGADAMNPDAVRRIFAAKGRPFDHPLIVHIASAEALNAWAASVPAAAQQLAAHFWPGPLALVLNKKPGVPGEVTGGQDTVALRVPNHPAALRLLQAFNGGIAAPSANRFCRISPTQASHVAEELGDSVDLILDGGACQVGVESTIVDLSGDRPRLLRPGHITRQALEGVLQTELLTPVLAGPSDIRVSGMMAVHYAPLTTAMLCPLPQLVAALPALAGGDQRIGILAYQFEMPTSRHIQLIRMPQQAENYAQALYASLRELDRFGLDRILVEQPPETAAWQAINDRLRKATVALNV
ncbi:MAG: L-threonylcarbamoyladenylate synthase [Methylovulum sp.]|nr:L-threonylcarbamoyladenylate synthase [Methylovulum sp.]